MHCLPFIILYVLAQVPTAEAIYLDFLPGGFLGGVLLFAIPAVFSSAVMGIVHLVDGIHHYFKCHAWQNRKAPEGLVFRIADYFYRRSKAIGRDDALAHVMELEKKNGKVYGEEAMELSYLVALADAIRLAVKANGDKELLFSGKFSKVSQQDIEDALAYRFDNLTGWRLLEILGHLGVPVEIRIGRPSDFQLQFQIDTRELRSAFNYPPASVARETPPSTTSKHPGQEWAKLQ